MLFDEPTSALDPEIVKDVLTFLRELARSGMTMVIVTHEIGFARHVADRVIFLDRGVVAEAGPSNAVLSNPTNPRLRVSFPDCGRSTICRRSRRVGRRTTYPLEGQRHDKSAYQRS